MQSFAKHSLLSRLRIAWLAGIVLLGAVAAQAAGAAELGGFPLTTYPAKKHASLRDYAGHVVLVNFWAPWCVPCREEFPELQALQAKYAARGLVVLGVTAEDDAKKIAHFLEKVPVSFQILQDQESSMHRAANVEMMPSTLLVDASGKVIKVYSGFSRERGLKEMEHDVAEQIGRKS
jgi:thiol-disulfide isomerase/thioredoxin